jgi:hypothetical protein
MQNVHEREIDRATGKAEIVRINPTRGFVTGGPGGLGWIWWQNGKFFDRAGLDARELTSDQVPAALRAQLLAHPPTVEGVGPKVTKVCRVCIVAGVKADDCEMNASQLEDHLLKHVDDLMKGSASAAKEDSIPPPVSQAA